MPFQATSHRPATVRLQPKVGLLFFAIPALTALLAVAYGTYRASNRSGNEANAVAERALTFAVKTVPFTVRLPAALPNDAQLVRVFLDKPDEKRGLQVYTLNTWYTAPLPDRDGGGRTIHVWQTNDPFLARSIDDPTQRPGVAETVAGRVWNRVLDDRVKGREVITYSARFDDDITIAVDGEDAAEVRATIEALQTVKEAPDNGLRPAAP